MKTHISSSQVDTAVFNFPPSVPQIEVFVLGSYMPLTKTPTRMPRFLKEKNFLGLTLFDLQLPVKGYLWEF